MDRPSGETSAAEQFPHWRRNMWTACLANGVANMGFSTSYPYWPLVVREMGFRKNLETWVGLVVWLYFLASLILTPFWGVLADHYGKKSMTLRAGFGMGLAFCLMALAPSFWWFLIPLLLAGACNGFIPAAGALLATNTPLRRIGTALSVAQIGAQAGNLAGPLLGAFLASRLSAYRHLFWVSGAGLAGAGLVAMLRLREIRSVAGEPLRLHLIRDAGHILRAPDMPVLFYLGFVFAATVYGATPVVSVLTLQMLAEAPAGGAISVEGWVGIVAMAMYASSIAALPFWGRMLDRYHHSGILAVILLATFLSSLAMPFVQSPLQLAGARLLFGLCAAGLQPAVMGMIRINAPRGMAARALYFGTVFHMLGNGLAPLVAGAVGPFFGLRVYLGVNCVLLLLGLVLWLRCMRRQPGLEPGAPGA